MDFIKREEVEIYKMICISTGHITSKTRQYLNECSNGCQDIIVYRKEDVGWFIPVPDDKYPIPMDLADCIAFAEKHGAEYIMFDADGPINSELRVYEDEKPYLESLCTATEEHICMFVTSENPYVSYQFIIENDSTDISAALENTLYRLLENGGTPEDIKRILGAEIPEDYLEDGEFICIDLGYVIRGEILYIK